MLTLPADLDLAARDSFAVLRRLDAVCLWPDVKVLCPQLRAIRLTVPPRAVLEEDIAVYPGGALAIRDPLRGVLVCDPAAAATFTGTGALRLRDAVANGGGTAAILHMRTGIVLQNDLPHRLPPQAVSLLSDARSLPGLASQHGPVLIQWLAGGATLWPLVSAPPLLALAATISAVPIRPNRVALPSETFYGSGSDPRYALLSPGLAEHVSDLLAAELSDALRFALVEIVVEGDNSLASRMSAALAVLPACFRLSPLAYPGDPPPEWRASIKQMRRRTHPLVLLGVQTVGDAWRTILACQKTVRGRSAVVVNETTAGTGTAPVSLDSDAAMFVARQAGPDGHLGLLLAPPSGGPADLYALAVELAQETAAGVVAASPCWGFCHRIGPDGEEAGNASWFGMGPGLDELDDLMPDVTSWD